MTGKPLMLLQPDEERFAPFGSFVRAPSATGARQHYTDWLNADPDRRPHLHVNHVSASALPMTVGQVEKHPFAAQVFLPLDVGTYMVLVMPSDRQGQPDPDRALGFLVPSNTGVIYRAGVWHASATVFDRTGHFAVLMWRNGNGDDVFCDIPPMSIRAPADDPLLSNEKLRAAT